MKETFALTRQDKKYLRMALVLALSSDCRTRHGCLIVRGGNILAAACNRWRNVPQNVSPEHVHSGCTTHAEIVALSRTKRARGATMYVARANRNGQPMLSRPCDDCYNALIKAGIREVVYT